MIYGLANTAIGKTLTIESDGLDFVNSKNDLDYVIKLVLDKLNE